YGDDMEAWEWGAYHKVQFYHPLSDVNPVLAYVFNREKPISVGGSSVTPMAASYDNETGEVDHGASWRFVIDMAEADVGYHIVSPGQDGHFKSQWYYDQMDDWVDGSFHKTKLSGVDGDRLILTPYKCIVFNIASNYSKTSARVKARWYIGSDSNAWHEVTAWLVHSRIHNTTKIYKIEHQTCM